MRTSNITYAKKQGRRAERKARRLRPLLVPLEERHLLSTFIVTNTSDNSSVGSLRWAIAQANNDTGASAINFKLGASPATITLSQDELELGRTSGSIAINGPGASLLTINGNNNSRIFGVYQGVTTSISGLTLTAGAEGPGYSGGGLYNAGTATISNCTITGNSAYGGGGVANFGVATLTNCTISGNKSQFGTNGGGLKNTGTMTLTGCAVTDNSAWFGGGGVYNIDGSATLTDCTIKANSSLEYGAGVLNGSFNDRTGSMTLSNCTISGNTGAYTGGGLFNLGNTVALTGCAISGNSGSGLANEATANLINCTITGNGPGVTSYGTTNLTACTISGNSIAGVASTYPGITITDSIVAGNYSSAGIPFDISGVVEGSNNVIGSAGSDGPTNGIFGYENILLANVNGLGLAPLADNGGPTQTMALLSGSVAIGAGIPVTGVTTDQRGQPLDSPRPDIGAYQTQPGQAGKPVTTFTVTSTGDNGSTGTLRWAIEEANKEVGAVTIDFNLGAAAATISLSAGELELLRTSGSIAIDGPGAGLLTIDGADASRVFQVDNGVTASLSGLTIAGGAAGSHASGGGLYSAGTTSLTNCTVSGNSAYQGGGVYSAQGSTSLTDCTITGNLASQGAGVENGSSSSSSGSMTLTNCTLSGNVAAEFGGGLCNYATTLTLTACTISGNSASAVGGGLYRGAGTVTLMDTLVAGNSGIGDSPSDIYGTVSGSYNLVGTGGSGGLTSGLSGNIILTTLTALNLAPLSNNGGTTQTIALLLDSPAIGAGTSVHGVTTDQRGQPVDWPHPDIGAFQTQPGLPGNPVATIMVTSTADNSSEGTLRWAIARANSSTTPTRIELKLGTAPATVVLTQGPLELKNTTGTTTIYDGPGEGPVTVSGNEAGRVLAIDSHVTASITGLTIAGGSSTPLFDYGGGVENFGTLTLADCIISGNSNSASTASGLDNEGIATLLACTVSGNAGSQEGQVRNTGTLTLASCTIGNAVGDGIDNVLGTATLFSCTISGNSGAGLYNRATATLTDCTITGNGDGLNSGNEFSYSAKMIVTACTISGNNSETYSGGGVFVGGGSVTLSDTIVAGNSTLGGASDIIVGQGQSVSGAFNLIGIGGSGGLTGGSAGNNVLTSLAGLELGSLADNGGPTQTMALAPGSPAIAAGTVLAAVKTDERGQPIDTPYPDIGAYQSQLGQTIKPPPTFIVTSTADDGSAGTLRWAVAQANEATAPSTIQFSLGTGPVTITLAEGELNLSNASVPVTIDGVGENLLTISGDGTDRVFEVGPGVIASLIGLTITGGTSTGNGGGLYNNGNITLTDCVISGNHTGSFGGGICNNATIALTDCTISGNSAAYYGGGIHSYNGSTTLVECTVSGNSAGKGGGGVDAFNTTTTLTGCTVDNNTAVNGGGGLSDALGTTTLSNDTFSGNYAGSRGGGLAISNLTTLTNCTISGNTGTFGSGGIYLNVTAALYDTIVAGNASAYGASDIAGSAAVSGSDNLIGIGGSDGLSDGVDGNIVLTSLAALGLGPLANNGGPTETMALLPGSAAIESGAFEFGIVADQRSQPLDFPQPDIGAFQTQTGHLGPGAFIVTSALDDGSAGTLRWAITQANLASSPSHIEFELGAGPATVTLTQGQLELTNSSASVAIYNGPGQGPITISGNGSSRVLQMDRGVTASLSGLTITGGATSGNGGGLYNFEGTLTLNDCTISGSSAQNGGGLENFGSATLTDCIFSGNSATRGGGLFSFPYSPFGPAVLSMYDCTISGNSATLGGGLYTYNGTATIMSCTLSGNNAQNGGGLYNTGTAVILDTTISGNSAQEGGGLFNAAPGGGRYNLGEASLAFCTIADNSASAFGGGLYDGGSASLTTTIVARNIIIGASPSDIALAPSGSVTGTYALIGIGGSGGISDGSQGNIVLTSLAELGLATLADNGGPTETMALLPGSLATNAGTSVAGISTDQRGLVLDTPNPDIGAFQAQSGEAPPPTFIVTSALDDGSSGTLRWAIEQADAVATASTIEIELGAAPATITLLYGALSLTNSEGPMAIADGQGQGPVTISGNNAGSVFQISQGVTASLSGLTITGGSSSAIGNAVANEGTATLTNCIITGNVTTSASAFSGGGALFNGHTGSLYLDHCILSDNTAAQDGGALFNYGQATLVDCTISGNSAGALGGAIFNSYPKATITLTGCTISGNSAYKGGGIYNEDQLSLTDCTISGNSAQYGGGIENYGTAQLTACTISGNSAARGGGGLENFGSSYYTSTASLADTIVAGNTGTDGNADDISGNQAADVMGSYDLIGTGGFGGIINGSNGDIVLTDLANLGLSPLGDNGGPTSTMALLTDSVAIEMGTAVSGISTDQRGQPLDSPQPDIGAFQTQTGSQPVLTLIVTSSLDDSSIGTLRWAIAQANSATLPSAIEIELGTFSSTIALSQGQLELSNASYSISIEDGTNQGPVTISGNNAGRVFQIDQGVVASLTGLTITGGSTGGNGGGLYNAGTTTITNCTISGNASTSSVADTGGGGIFNSDTGELTLTGCKIDDNSAGRDGGGLFNAGAETAVDCTVSGNSAAVLGGGNFNDYSASISLSACTVSGNSALYGGGISTDAAVTLVNCNISGNSAAVIGGGIFNHSKGSLTLTGCTVSGNSAQFGGGLANYSNATLTSCTISGNTARYGAGVLNYGEANLTACTVSANSASSRGGGLYNYGASAAAALIDTIVAGNSGASGTSDDISGSQAEGVTGSFDLIGTGGSGGIVNGANGNIVLTDLGVLGLAPLADNGGPTQTMALLPASIAIDEGTAFGDINTDQRGQPLDFPQPDIGAFQTQTGQLPFLTFVVTSTLDDGSSGTLRWAIAQANFVKNASEISIELGPDPSTIMLSQGQLELFNTSNSIAIYDESGQGPVTISGNNAGRVFQVDQGVTASFSDLTITGGDTSGNGGGLYNAGTTTLSNCTITGNTSTSSASDTGGAGIFNGKTGDLTLDHSILSDNTAGRDGGGLFNDGTATLVGCSVSGNSVSIDGAGLFNDNAASMTVATTTISGNSAAGAGSGINNDGIATLVGCTISGNTGAFSGGGIAQYYPGSISLTNCTVSGNSGRYGGGLSIAGMADLTACTISGNSASSGGGIYNYGTSSYTSTVSLVDTIVAGNTASECDANEIRGNDASNVTGSYDLIGIGGSGGIANGVSGDIVLTDLTGLGLAPLGDYGGTTQTIALLPGSLALGAGVAVSGISADQRGETLDSSPDIGAFQSQGFTLVALTGSTPQTTSPGDAFATTLGVTIVPNNPLEPVAGGLVVFAVNPAAGGAGAELSAGTAIIGTDGVAQVAATANAKPGPYTVTASGAASTTPIEFSLDNVGVTVFSGLTDQTVTFGVASVTVSGALAGDSWATQSEAVAVTLDGKTLLAAIDADGGFSITLDTSSLVVTGSPFTITYSFAGDLFFAATSASSDLFVTPAAPTVFISDSGGTYFGSAFVAAATVAEIDGSAAPSLEGVAPSIAYYTGNYTLVGQLNDLTPLAAVPAHPGTYTALASFAGTADFLAGSALVSFTIIAATPTVSALDAGGSYSGTPFGAVGKVAGVVAGTDTTPAPQLEGVGTTLTYYNGTYSNLTQLAGLTPLVAAPIHPGQYTVLARFAGSPDYTFATALVGFTIAKEVPQINWSAPESIVYGTPLSSAMLNAQANVPGSYVYDVLAGAIIGAGTSQVLAVTFTPVDLEDYTNVSAATAIDVVRAAPILTVSAPGGAYTGAPLAAAVTFEVNSGAMKEFVAGTLESVAPDMAYYQGTETSGPALGATPPTGVGTYTVVASFAGSADFVAAVSAPVTFTISRGATSVVVAASSESPVFGQSLMFVATVTAAGGAPNGVIAFFDGTTPLGSAPIDGSGQATLPTSSLAVGSHSITATYAGNSNLLGATFGPISESVAPDATATVLVPLGLFKKKKLVSVGLTAEVEAMAPGAGTPTGTITFMFKNKSVGTATLNGGMATLTVKASSVLKKAITIVYTGDGSFGSSTVTAPTLTQRALANLGHPKVAMRRLKFPKRF